MAHRPRKTHRIRRVGTLSALDCLDIADEGGTKRGIIRADDSPVSFFPEKGRGEDGGHK